MEGSLTIAISLIAFYLVINNYHLSRIADHLKDIRKAITKNGEQNNG